MKLNQGVLLVLLSPLLALAAKDIEFCVLVPPEKPLEGVKRIAVMDFGDDGTLANHIIERLTNGFTPTKELNSDEQAGQFFATLFTLGAAGNVHGEGNPVPVYEQGSRSAIYEIIERTQLARIIEEQRLGQSGLVDDSTAARIGKLAGVDAIITGSYSLDRPSDVVTVEEESRYDSETKKSYKVNVRYITRKAAASISSRIVLTESGRVINTLNDGAKRSYKRAEDNRDQLPSQDAMLGDCLYEVVRKLTAQVLPKYRYNALKILKDKTKSKESKEARKLADKGRLLQALAAWEVVLKEDEYNAPLLYNVGLIYEAYGHLDKARELYQTAYQVQSNAPEYDEGLSRIEQRQREIQALAGIDVFIQPGVIDQGQVNRAMEMRQGDWVTLKGDAAKRFPLYTAADKGSAVVTQVPGGMRLESLGEQGEFYEVTDPKGRKGYVCKKDCK